MDNVESLIKECQTMATLLNNSSYVWICFQDQKWKVSASYLSVDVKEETSLIEALLKLRAKLRPLIEANLKQELIAAEDKLASLRAVQQLLA